MRFIRFTRLVIITVFFASTAQATVVISQQTLDQTLLDAQIALEKQDYPQAFVLYQTAAQWGHKGAQYVLGELYLRGKGVERDAVVGYAWLEVASEAPDREFRKARTAAGKTLSDEQKQQADELAQKLVSTYGLDAAGITCRKEMRLGSNIKEVNCYHVNTTPGGDLIVPDGEVDLDPAS